MTIICKRGVYSTSLSHIRVNVRARQQRIGSLAKKIGRMSLLSTNPEKSYSIKLSATPVMRHYYWTGLDFTIEFLSGYPLLLVMHCWIYNLGRNSSRHAIRQVFNTYGTHNGGLHTYALRFLTNQCQSVTYLIYMKFARDIISEWSRLAEKFTSEEEKT